MQVTITIPQSFLELGQEYGWEEQEIAILFKRFINEATSLDRQDNFFEWVEDQDEEQLGDLFRAQQELEVGMEVEIVKQSCNSSLNEVGDVGIITEMDGETCRVQVEGRQDYSNWEDKSELARVNY